MYTKNSIHFNLYKCNAVYFTILLIILIKTILNYFNWNSTSINL